LSYAETGNYIAYYSAP